MKTAIVLFCDDFRTKDNPALYYACQKYDNIIPVFIYNQNYLGRKIGSAAKVFLHNVLIGFNNLLGGKLVIKQGDIIKELADITNKMPIDAIYFNKSFSAQQMELEKNIGIIFANLDIGIFNGKVLFEPEKIKTGAGSYFRVFTPFSKECLKNKDLIGESLPEPIINSVHTIDSLSAHDLELLPQKDWHINLIKNWSFDYDKIKSNFLDFVNNKMDFYNENRNIPASNGSTNLSPYLRFGVMSPRFCFNIAFFREQSPNQFILEILWREFAYHVAFFNHNISTKELRPEYANFKWDNNQILLEKWQQGKTGFDFVDSGMIEMYKTGVMHGRTRMVVASFLIKDLLIDWRKGEEWFWDCLIDADYCINPFSWQWVFGSGFDSAPYFRIFNPESQKEKFDPNNTYCAKWLNKKNDKIVDHSTQRDIALHRYKSILAKDIACDNSQNN